MAAVGYFSLYRPWPRHVRLALATSRSTMARTEATSQLMSAFAPISSASPPASDVGGIPAKRGVMTRMRHWWSRMRVRSTRGQRRVSGPLGTTLNAQTGARAWACNSVLDESVSPLV